MATEAANRIEQDGNVFWVYFQNAKAARCWSKESAERVLNQLITTGEVEVDAYDSF